MRFGVLGPLEVQLDAERILRLTSAKQRLLLALLLAHRNTRVSTDRLLDSLWDGHPPRTARTNLQVYVHRLRRALGESRIVHRRSAYELVVHPGEADVELFEGLAERGRGEFDDGDPATAAETLDQALALWRSTPAYTDVEHVDAIRVDAARLSELYHATLELKIDAALRLGHHARLIPELTTLIEAHPLRQRLYLQLMLALHRTGRTAEALETYRRARTTMIEELGLEPSAELRELERAIIVGAPEVQAPAGGTDGSRLSVPFDPADTSGARVPAAGDGPTPPGTALSLQVHRADAEVGPDGRVILDVQGAIPGRSSACATLRALLRSLGFDDAAIPDGAEEMAALFHASIRGRRVRLLIEPPEPGATPEPLAGVIHNR